MQKLFWPPRLYGLSRTNFVLVLVYYQEGIIVTYDTHLITLQIPVRPFRHNEYERFITTAFPYYGASFSMVNTSPSHSLSVSCL